MCSFAVGALEVAFTSGVFTSLVFRCISVLSASHEWNTGEQLLFCGMTLKVRVSEANGDQKS